MAKINEEVEVEAAAEEPAVTLTPRAVESSDIIFGAGPIVADREGPIPQQQIDEAIDAALKAGIVDFDTAPLYGDSEDRLGHALAASELGDTVRQSNTNTNFPRTGNTRDGGKYQNNSSSNNAKLHQNTTTQLSIMIAAAAAGFGERTGVYSQLIRGTLISIMRDQMNLI